MAGKKKDNSEAWVVTFSDLMSLLFCFFVLLTTMSTSPKDCSGILEYMTENQELFKNFKLRSNRLACILSLPPEFLFESGKAELQKSAFKPLTPFFKFIKTHPAHEKDLVMVEGHTDNVPIRTQQFPSNWELSSARSIVMSQYLIKELGYPPTSVTISAYADSRPLVRYEDEDKKPLTGTALKKARDINRRIEIYYQTAPKALDEINILFGQDY